MTGFAFPRCLRLLNAGDYSSVFNDVHVRVADKHLLILARPNELSHPRVGLVIAKKHVRRAADRNQVKRILRESFRLHQHQLPNMDLVILARQGLGALEKPELHQLMEKSWKRLLRYAEKAANTPAPAGKAGQHRPQPI